MPITHLSGVENGGFSVLSSPSLVALEVIASMVGRGWLAECYLDPSARENLCLFHGRQASDVLLFLIRVDMELRELNQSILHIFKTWTCSFVSCHPRNGKADLGPHIPH